MLILAASGSGKTYHEKRNRDIVDGDKIIARTIGWPKEKEFWKGPRNKEIQARNQIQVLKYAFSHRDMIVVFNGEIEPRYIDAVVEIPEEDHIHHLNLRAQEQEDSTHKGQPVDWESVERNRKNLKSVADSSKTTEFFTSFEEAFKWARKEIAKLGDT
jgi:hypothetical protein